MGFYNNMSSLNKSVFQFDKIYPNKRTMEESAAIDGIFVGRYVLIDYDSEENIIMGYMAEENGVISIYGGPDTSLTPYDLTGKNFVLAIGQIINGEYIEFNKQDYRLFAVIKNENNTYTLSENFNIPNNKYSANYNVDKNKYGDIGRGWDSTVWQKTYRDGKLVYVMVAELNSVIPAFDIAVDAPTPTPITPHWDDASSNLYYKLHLQPSWGMRIKEAPTRPIEEGSQEQESYNTDVTGDFYLGYDFSNKQNIVQQNTPLALYWNADGFDKANQSKINNPQDLITITPTGMSQGSSYIDTYELSIALPSLGNTISDIWDIIYGVKKNKTERNLDISWNSLNGDSAYRNESHEIDGNFYPENLNTVAGIINSVHDLMGMIVIDKTVSDINEFDASGLDPNKIYNINNKYYFKNKTFGFSNEGISGSMMFNPLATEGEIYLRESSATINGEEFIDTSLSLPIDNISEENVYGIKENETFYQKIPFIKGQYYYLDGNEFKLAEEFDSTKTYFQYPNEYYITEVFSGNYEIGQAWNINDTIPTYEKIVEIEGEQTIENAPCFNIGYKVCKWNLRELSGLAKDINTLHGLILKINKILLEGDTDTRDTSTLQGAINVFNDLAHKLDVLNTIKSGNEWINIGSETNNNETNITVKHKEINAEVLTTSSNKNTPAGSNNTDMGTNKNKSVETDTGLIYNTDQLILHKPTIDEAGHVTELEVETVTLPYGYKTINNINATNTQDSLTIIGDKIEATAEIAAQDGWINIETNANNKKIKISHNKKIVEPESLIEKNFNNLSYLNSNDFRFNTWKLGFDDAGHYNSLQEYSYVIPSGFNAVQINGESNNKITASNPVSTLNIVSSEYIKPSKINQTLQFNLSDKFFNDFPKIGAPKENEEDVFEGKEKTFYELKSWLEEFIKNRVYEGVNSTTIQSNFWGVQIPIQATSVSFAKGGASNNRDILLNGSENSGLINYGFGNVSSFYTIQDSGTVKVNQSGTYRIQASLGFGEIHEQIIQFYIGIKRKVYNTNDWISVCGTTESFDATTMSTENLPALGTPYKLIYLNKDDELKINFISKTFTNKNTPAITLNILNNENSYLILEKVENSLHDIKFAFDSFNYPQQILDILPNNFRWGEDRVNFQDLDKQISNKSITLNGSTWYFLGWKQYIGNKNINDVKNNPSIIESNELGATITEKTELILDGDDILLIGSWANECAIIYDYAYDKDYPSEITRPQTQASTSHIPYTEAILPTISSIRIEDNEHNIKGTWIFSGWKFGNNTVTSITMPAYDIVVTGYWTFEYDLHYTITYEYDESAPVEANNTLPKDQFVYYTEENQTVSNVSLSSPTDTAIVHIDNENKRYIYEFDKWTYLSTNVVVVTVSSDMTIIGKWKAPSEELPKYVNYTNVFTYPDNFDETTQSTAQSAADAKIAEWFNGQDLTEEFHAGNYGPLYKDDSFVLKLPNSLHRKIKVENIGLFKFDGLYDINDEKIESSTLIIGNANINIKAKWVFINDYVTIQYYNKSVTDNRVAASSFDEYLPTDSNYYFIGETIVPIWPSRERIDAWHIGMSYFLADRLYCGEYNAVITEDTEFTITDNMITIGDNKKVLRIGINWTYDDDQTTYPSSISIDSHSETVGAGDTLQLSATLTPQDITSGNDGIVWNSSDSSIATIDSATGLVSGIAPGTVTITVTTTATRFGTCTDSCEIEVLPYVNYVLATVDNGGLTPTTWTVRDPNDNNAEKEIHGGSLVPGKTYIIVGGSNYRIALTPIQYQYYNYKSSPYNGLLPSDIPTVTTTDLKKLTFTQSQNSIIAMFVCDLYDEDNSFTTYLKLKDDDKYLRAYPGTDGLQLEEVEDINNGEVQYWHYTDNMDYGNCNKLWQFGATTDSIQIDNDGFTNDTSSVYKHMIAKWDRKKKGPDSQDIEGEWEEFFCKIDLGTGDNSSYSPWNINLTANNQAGWTPIYLYILEEDASEVSQS